MERLAVLVFAKGLAAEQVRTASFPWDRSWETRDSGDSGDSGSSKSPEDLGDRSVPPRRLMSAVAEVLRDVGEGWAFLAAIDSSDGTVVGRAVDLGRIAPKVAGGEDPAPSPQGQEASGAA